MKKSKAVYITAIIVMAISLFGCSKSKDKPIDPDNPPVNPDNPRDPDKPDPNKTFYLSFKNTPKEELKEINANENSSAYLLIIESDKKWSATTDAKWIKLGAWDSENSKMGLLLALEKNYFTPRQASVTFKSGNESKTVTIRQSGAPKIDFEIDNIKFSMIYVEGGCFMHGESDFAPARYSHYVCLDSYYICETQVTNEFWESVIGSLPYDILLDYRYEQDAADKLGSKPQAPVSAVSWDEINGEFLNKVSYTLGYDFRLPTEAEWEYAAMGGVNRDEYIFAGSDEAKEVAWHYSNCEEKQDVAQLKPNSLGLYDMSGNVYEWCFNWFSEPYETNEENVDLPDGSSVSATVNPKGPKTGTKKVVRGGSFESGYIWQDELKVKYRHGINPSGVQKCWGDTGHPDEPDCLKTLNVGFRFVLPLN